MQSFHNASAAPLALDIARCLQLAKRRGEGGVVEHAFPAQQTALMQWLGVSVPKTTE